MGHPAKSWSEDKVGENVQLGYDFLDNLFDDVQGPQIRNAIFQCNSQAAMRTLLEDTYGLQWIPVNVNIMVLDIENARVWPTPIPNNFKDKNWYTLVLPPNPRRNPNNGVYTDSVAWNAAWYHAMADGYGM